MNEKLEQISVERKGLRSVPRIAYVLGTALIALIFMHTIMVALWVTPTNEIARGIGTDRLSSYINPMFEQNWSIFAPNPWSAAVTFEVRAEFEDPVTGETNRTEWVELVQFEDELVRGNPMPSRSMGIARTIAQRLNSNRLDMTEDQRRWITANYRETPLEELEQGLLDNGVTARTVRQYMRAERAANALATAYMFHYSEMEPTAVQYRTTGRSVPDFSERHTRGIDDVLGNVREFGWRGPVQLTQQELDLFEPYVKMGGGQ